MSEEKGRRALFELRQWLTMLTFLGRIAARLTFIITTDVRRRD